MAATGMVEGMLQRSRRRVIAGVLGHCERAAWWSALTAEQQRALKEQVQASANAYHEVSLDLLKVAVDDHVLISEQALRMIEDIHERTA